MSATLLVLVVLTAPSAGGAGDARSSKADRLVEQALEAELQGDNAKRKELLDEALRSWPQCEAARWQTGHVRVGRKWLTLAESQQATLRSPSLLRRICIEQEEIEGTLGHPFWVSGHGWRMVKLLEGDERLHGLEGSWPIRRIDELPEDEAYNLVVDEFHTYFVSRLGLLVHDNIFREPTTAVLPGLHRVRE